MEHSNPIVKKSRSFRHHRGLPNRCYDVLTYEEIRKRYRVWASSPAEAKSIVCQGEMRGEEVSHETFEVETVELVDND